MGDEVSTSSFSQFADALSQSRDQPVSSLLDSANGLALLFAETCEARATNAFEEAGTGGLGSLVNRRIQQGTNDGSEPFSGFLDLYEEDEGDDALAWRLEEQTWRLIHHLHAERVQRINEQRGGIDGDALASTSKSSPYRTPFAAVQDILEADAALSELKIVRDWLSNNLSYIHQVEVRKGYWPFTKNKLRNERRSGSSGNTQASKSRPSTFGSKSAFASTAMGKGVKSLDPDATTREGSTLELEDAAYEKALNKTLFEYTRGGQLDNAIDLARQTDRTWRAASLRGATLYWRSGLDNDMDDELTTPMGNRNRALWKAVCRSLCAKSSVDEYERALYGALSGDLKSVLNVSTTWDAQLWAHANARLESAIDHKLNKLDNWWSQDAADRFGLSSTSKELGSVQLQELRIPGSNAGKMLDTKMALDEDAPLAVELRDVFIKLGQTEQNNVNVQANHPFRIVQRAIILSELPALLTHIESLLPSMRVTVSPQQYARLTRFFAHLILFLRLIKWDNMPNDIVCNSILKAYVDVLENVGEADLVALYASSLERESATESYAHYLKLMEPREQMEAKEAALRRAQENDLDVAAVASTVVAMILDEIIPSMASNAPIPKIPLVELSVGITPSEERLIRAIDWLCIDESTHITAIVTVNQLLRLFLNNGRLNAARTLLFDVPSDVIEKIGLLEDSGDEDLQATEFVHWRSFFDALDHHLRFVELWNRRPAENAPSRLDRLNWTKALNGVVEDAQIAIRQVLEMDWIKLSLPILDTQTALRLEELTRIRRIYIPELVFRLHSMLYESSSVLKHTLASVIQLPNLVADENHKLYLDFIAGDDNRLPEYLELVRIAGMSSLGKNPDPFYWSANTQTGIGQSA